jgi:amphiphysin
VYERINNQLVQEIPKLIDLRVPYLNPTFEAFIKIELILASEYYSLLSEVERMFPSGAGAGGDTALYQGEVEGVLQKMRELTICGLV